MAGDLLIKPERAYETGVQPRCRESACPASLIKHLNKYLNKILKIIYSDIQQVNLVDFNF